ncbi:type II toxin-antitoxin system mRNA interferase toxin, RelE/StbE family [Candidatus Saccharibacteria bacterium]|nr:type II toxin-antitoxin system mRNA interferase toxin, RelE/StbE family [Candidatus Saccharibacteria bacterium]
MKFKYSKRFRKQFQKLRASEQKRFWSRLELFIDQPNAKLLHHHVLQGKYAGLHSINIGGDLRALYLEKDDQLILFELIGTHSQLYG